MADHTTARKGMRPIIRQEIVFQDPFHLKLFYRFMFFWLWDNGWVQVEGSPTEKELEVYYSEEVRTGDVKEIHFWWRPYKQPENPYFRYHLWIDVLLLGIRDTEIMHNDKKLKVNIGEISIRINSFLETEASKNLKNFGKKGLTKQFKDYWNDYWYGKKIEWHEDLLSAEVVKFQNAMKEFFAMKQWDAPAEIFDDQKGLDS